MLVGGAGNDLYIVDDANDVVVENVAEGIDTVQTSLANASIAGYDNVENIIYTGTVDVYLTGNSLDNILTGSLSATLSNTYDGGSGHDTINYGSVTAAMLINLMTGVATGAGTDKIMNIENVIGGSSNDNIVGNERANIRTGGAGNDVLTGGAGNDAYNFARGDGADS